MEWLHPDHLIAAFGMVGILLIVFVESGLLVGFFLPGDSLLFTAGLFASRGDLDITPLALGAIAAAILGDQVGFQIGRRVGPRMLTNDRWWSRPHHVARAQAFFAAHGARAIVLARFIPVVRTFVPVVAGIAGMPVRAFVLANAVGGVLWGGGVTLAGFLLGELVPGADRYLLPIVVGIVLVSILPAARHLRRPARPLPSEQTPVAAEGAL